MLGGTPVLAGCTAPLSIDSTRDVYNPTGRATIRPLDTPLISHGIDSNSDRYLYARMFHPGDSLSVTDEPDAEWYSEAVSSLATGQFAILTNLRTAASAPAHFWPIETGWQDGQLQIKLERETKSLTESCKEVVGVALTIFNVDGEPPEGAEVIVPGGATISVGTTR